MQYGTRDKAFVVQVDTKQVDRKIDVQKGNIERDSRDAEIARKEREEGPTGNGQSKGGKRMQTEERERQIERKLDRQIDKLIYRQIDL